jgi:hypothetical protein
MTNRLARGLAAVLTLAVAGGIGLLGDRLRPYWVAKYRGENALLHGALLTGAPLHGANLTQADLSAATLRRADLSQACLRGAAMRGADLRGASLQGTDLSGHWIDGTSVVWSTSLEGPISGVPI